MKRFIKTIKMNVLSAVFIVMIMLGMVSVSISFSHDIVRDFLQTDTSVSFLFNSSKKKLFDVRDGVENLEPYNTLKAFYVHIYGLTQRVIGNDYVYDADKKKDVVRMNNGYITSLLPELSDKRLSEITDGITEFAGTLAEEKINCLYIQLPFKVCANDKELPVGVEDYSNENADRVLSVLEKSSVDTFDIREQFEKDEISFYSLFFRTDHHWMPSTALWASQKICEKLNSDYGFNTNSSLLDTSRFSQTTYKKFFLGSLGKRVGRYYAGVDDFTLILPVYDTDMIFSFHSLSDHYLDGEEFRREGTFYDACIDKTRLEKNLMYQNPYAAYSGNDFSETVTVNKNISEGKILLIRDSFCDTAAPFICLAACRELYTLDLRHFYGSVAEYTKNLKPDIVIVMLNPSVFPEYNFDFISKR